MINWEQLEVNCWYFLNSKKFRTISSLDLLVEISCNSYALLFWLLNGSYCTLVSFWVGINMVHVWNLFKVAYKCLWLLLHLSFVGTFDLDFICGSWIAVHWSKNFEHATTNNRCWQAGLRVIVMYKHIYTLHNNILVYFR